jgi:nucleolar protein 56
MRAWFGEISPEGSVSLSGRTAVELSGWATVANSESIDKSLDLERLAINAGLCSDFIDYRRLLHETAVSVAKEHITSQISGQDAYIIHAVNALDDLNDAYNALTERLTEWYGIHYPELRARPQELIAFILQYGSREASGSVKAVESMGADMSENDIHAVQGLASAAQKLFDTRKDLEKYVSSTVESFAPNLSSLLGPLLAARFIALAGGLDKLARMPASTIQVMGAGEALFKHLRAGAPSPKHGLIFNHPLISGSPKRIRGKVSRMLSAKTAIAARVDYYSGNPVDLGDIKAKVEEIKKRSGRKKK